MAFKAEGFSRRLTEEMFRLGYMTAEKTPDVPRFSRDHGYERQNVYNWLKGTTPDNASLEKLEKDLGVPWQLLLIGRDGYGAIKRYLDERDRGESIAHIRSSPRATPLEKRARDRRRPA